MSKTQSVPMIFAHISLMLVALSASSKTFSQNPSFERPPIDYHNAETLDPISQLAVKVQTGDVELQHEKDFGYLRSLLKALDVPLSSQTLVFSKTSLLPRELLIQDWRQALGEQ